MQQVAFISNENGFEIFTGTAKQFISRGLTINGKAVNQAEVSILKGLGIASAVGILEKPKGKKGKSEVIYRLVSTEQVKVQCNAA